MPTTNQAAGKAEKRARRSLLHRGGCETLFVILVIVSTAAMFHSSRHLAALSSYSPVHQTWSEGPHPHRRRNAEPSSPSSQPSDEERQKWESLKRAMCPDMAPNQKVWPTLFELARVELGFADEYVRPNKLDGPFYTNFFAFNPGGVGWKSSSGDDSMMYLRVWKAGNDQIRLNLNATLSNEVGHFWEEEAREMWAPIPRAERNRTCVVTAVRDPVGHFLSGYNEMEHRVATKEDGHQWMAPGKIQPKHFARYRNGTEARFEQFVADFVAGAKSTGIYPSTPNWNIYHVFSMTGVLWGLKQQRNTLGSQAPRLTSYLASLRGLNTEFPNLIMRDCHGLPQVAGEPWHRTFDHDSQLDEFGFYDAAKRVWGRQGATARALCTLHALDYACFDRVPVPTLCQSVFAGADFHNKLMEKASQSAIVQPVNTKSGASHARNTQPRAKPMQAAMKGRKRISAQPKAKLEQTAKGGDGKAAKPTAKMRQAATKGVEALSAGPPPAPVETPKVSTSTLN